MIFLTKTKNNYATKFNVYSRLYYFYIIPNRSILYDKLGHKSQEEKELNDPEMNDSQTKR